MKLESNVSPPGIRIVASIVGAFLLAVWTVPILLAVITSVKNEKEVLAYPPTLIFEPTLKNFESVLFGPTNIVGNLTSSLVNHLID